MGGVGEIGFVGAKGGGRREGREGRGFEGGLDSGAFAIPKAFLFSSFPFFLVGGGPLLSFVPLLEPIISKER